MALHGLADIGDAQDATAAAESLTDPRARVRAAATRLLATRGGRANGDVLVGLVSDPSSRVATEAIRGILARGLSEAAVDSWNRSFTEPLPQELDELRTSLDEARQHWPRQDAALADKVASILDHSSPRRR